VICLNGNFRFRFKEGLDSDFEAFEAFELKHALLQQIICTDLNHSESRELQTFWASGSKLANLPRLAIPQSCYAMLNAVNALDPGSRDVQGLWGRGKMRLAPSSSINTTPSIHSGNVTGIVPSVPQANHEDSNVQTTSNNWIQ